MGGLGPGIGGSEWFIIGLVALLVVGPERLPGLLRQLGKMVAKARGMANEFRASFDEMARQSELDELRKEVEALRSGQGPVRLGAEADAAFKGIKDEFDKPLFADTPAPHLAETVVPEAVVEPAMTPDASEWPDGQPVMAPIATPPLAEADLVPVAAPAKTAAKRKAPARAAASPAKAAAKTSAHQTSTKPPAAKTAAARATSNGAAPKAPAPRTSKPRAPRNSKLDL